MILGDQATEAELSAYGQGVVAEFLRFIAEIAMAQHLSRKELLARIGAIEGNEHFEAALNAGQGLIIATCHCGNFEVGAAAVAERVSETHVLFQGDVNDGFESMRARLHRQLGLVDAPVEQGLAAWMQLRDALARGGAVLIQADRCMPGQDGVATPFLHGQLEMPQGPAKLARISNAPILPVACVIQEDGSIRLITAPPITPRGQDAASFDAHARARLSEFFAGIIRKYPTQWHALHRAFVDSPPTPRDDDDARR